MMRAWIMAVLLLSACAAGAQQSIDSMPVGHLVVHPYHAKRMVAAFGQGVYYTRDGGLSWLRPASLPGLVNTERLFAHPGQPDVVYLKKVAWFVPPLLGPRPETTPGGQLYRSADFGQTWTLVAEDGNQPPAGFEARVVTPAAVDPGDPTHLYGTKRGLLVCRLCGGFDQRDLSLHESRDGGATWSGPLFDSGSSGFIHVSYPTPADPRRLFVVADGYAAHLSVDGGRTWSRFVPGFTHTPFWIQQDPHDGRVLYASGTLTDGSRNVVARSDDGGLTWRYIREFPALEPHVGRLFTDPYRPGRIWLSVQAGLLMSDDRGGSWSFAGYEGPQRNPSNGGEYLVVSKVVPGPAEDLQAYLVAEWQLRTASGRFRPRVAIEYKYGDRYWVSGDRGESASQDYRADEAVRTGEKFGVWSRGDAPPGAKAMCRFQGEPSRGQSSRFLAVDGFECDLVKGIPQFVLEGEGEYFAMPPSEGGTCAAGLVPVRRFNNLQADVNHRYVADPAIAEQIRAAGWYDEGVRFCARPLGSNE